MSKQATEALSAECYRLLFEDNPHPMWIYDLETLAFLEVNGAAIEHYGYPREEFLSMTIKDIRPPEDIPRLLDNVARVSEGIDEAGIWRHKKKNGSLIFVEITSHTFTFDGRRSELVMAHDVTARMLVEEELRIYYRMVSATHDHMSFVDRDYRYLAVNDAYLVAHERSREEIIGHSVPELLGQKIFDSLVRQNLDRCLDGEVVRYSAWFTFRGKGRRYMEVTYYPYRADGAVTGVVVYSRDATERHQLHEQLLQMQKMESLGQLASGIAHDFNNILGGILGYADMALTNTDENHPLYNDLKNIVELSRKGAGITRQLLAFSRRQAMAPANLDMNRVISNILGLIEKTLGEHIVIEFIPDPALNHVYADLVQMEQVLVNLCVNARDAMPGGGRLVVAASNAPLDQEFCKMHPGISEGMYIRLTVSDTGQGISEDVQKRMFEPFFTTKETGRGTGLGLSIVYGIVGEHGGCIDVDSKPGQGTTFSIYLPAIERHETQAAEQPALSVRKGIETIILVEDDTALCEFMKKALEKYGYTVYSAANGEEGLTMYMEHASEVKLVVSDMVMPKMRGGELYRSITSLNPHVMFLFVSGYVPDSEMDRLAMECKIELLYKPFTGRDLGVKVRDILDRLC